MRRLPRATRLTLVAVLALLPCGVAAHQQGISYSDVDVDDGRVRYDLTVANHDLLALDSNNDRTVTETEVVARYPALRRELEGMVRVETGGVPCVLGLEDFILDPTGAVTFRLRGTCSEGGPLRIAFEMLAATGSNGYNLAKIRYQGGLEEHVFTRDDTEVVVNVATDVRATVLRFALLGIEHIATGYDHVLFLLALLVIGGGLTTLVGILAAFTVAHSLTLALATFDVVILPGRVIESAIALSIVWVAVENVVVDRSHGRWRIAFVFGLVHGFGFASVLRSMQLPGPDLLASLVSFNLGIEAGQAALALAAYPFVTALERVRQRRLIVCGVSGILLALALYWFVERAFL